MAKATTSKSEKPAVKNKNIKSTGKANGRPSIYSPKVAADICSHIVAGKSLASYCAKENTPSIQTVYNWLATNKQFLELYTRAREDQADTLTDESVDIADNVVGTPIIVEGVPLLIDGKPLTVVDAAAVNHAKLKIETRKWFASKLKPKKYGDKLDIEHSGNVGIGDALTKALQGL